MVIKVNITADRNTEAAAPVSKENNHRQLKIKITCANFDFFTNGILANNHTSIT